MPAFSAQLAPMAVPSTISLLDFSKDNPSVVNRAPLTLIAY